MQMTSNNLTLHYGFKKYSWWKDGARIFLEILFLMTEGSLEMSLNELAKEVGTTVSKLRTLLANLEKDNLIKINTANKITQLTLFDTPTYEESSLSQSQAMFDEFWELYPRKDAKVDAQKAFKKVSSKDFEEIKRAVQTALDKGLWNTTQRHFIPLPATFLRGQRWKDEALKPQKLYYNQVLAIHSDTRDRRTFANFEQQQDGTFIEKATV